MNVENMKKFITALRSGDFRQSRFSLLSTEPNLGSCNCALGVAATLIMREGGPIAIDHVAYQFVVLENGVKTIGDTYGVIRRWLGVTSETESRIIDMNDNYGKTFEEIANELEFRMESECL
jgi:hypothetical protein